MDEKGWQMSLNVSRYNHFFQADDGYILAYNALTNTFARVTEPESIIIKKILIDPKAFSFDTQEKKKLKDDLIKGGFLIDEEFDEIAFLKMRNRIGRFSTDNFGLTIAPTLECNFECEYCFERPRLETMSVEVETALLKMVKDKLSSAKEFSVVWFGGEPLLEIEIISRLNTAFKKLCKKYKVVFSPQMIITNGYLLTMENAKRLKELNIASAQITIDGPPEIHNSRRKLRGGEGTFEQIIANIKDSMEYIDIVVRVNVDKENCKETDQLFDIFEKNGFIGKIPFYLGQVISSTDACADVLTRCFNVKDFSTAVIESMKRGVKARPYTQYPMIAHFGVCCADKYNSYVVTPSGALFKCWSEVTFDESKSVGHLIDEYMKSHQLKNLMNYLNWDPFENKQCLKCKFFPICGGGCPYFSLNSMEHCTTWKYHLKEMLKIRYEEIKKIKIKGGYHGIYGGRRETRQD